MSQPAKPTDLPSFLDTDAIESNGASTAPSGPLVEAAFYADTLPSTLRDASEDNLNKAAFGIIKLDGRGHVTFYNRFESRFSGRSPAETIGRNFFDEVAPCTGNRLFQNRFERGLADGKLDTTFSYTFTYRIRPTLVDVRMIVRSPKTGWVLVRPKAGPAA